MTRNHLTSLFAVFFFFSLSSSVGWAGGPDSLLWTYVEILIKAECLSVDPYMRAFGKRWGNVGDVLVIH